MSSQKFAGWLGMFVILVQMPPLPELNVDQGSLEVLKKGRQGLSPFLSFFSARALAEIHYLQFLDTANFRGLVSLGLLIEC